MGFPGGGNAATQPPVFDVLNQIMPFFKNCGILGGGDN
jgi:hypothetical protein